MADIATLQAVEWVETARELVLDNNVSIDAIDVRAVRDNHQMCGALQIVGVCDSGLDQGVTARVNLHLDFQDGAGNSRATVITTPAWCPTCTEGSGRA